MKDEEDDNNVAEEDDSYREKRHLDANSNSVSKPLICPGSHRSRLVKLTVLEYRMI